MKKHLCYAIALLLAISGVNAETKGKSAEILEESNESVVHVQAVVTQGDREREVETFGSIFDDKGTVVIANSAFRTDDFKDVKYVMADGTEVLATVVVKDPDLDIAFLQPTEAVSDDSGLTFKPLPFSEKEVELGVGDSVTVLFREGKTFRRQASLRSTRVVAVVETPRRYYRTDFRPAGAPAFDRRGEFIGVFVRRVDDGKPHHRVILPAANIVVSARQLAENAGDEAQSDTADSSALAEQALKETARSVFERHGDSVVNVAFLADINVSFGGNNQNGEQEIPLTGTVIREDGLTIVGDPTKQVRKGINQQIRAMLRGQAGPDINIGIEIKSVRITLGDGTEIPAKIIYQDDDLNIKFVMPDKDSDEAADVDFVPVELKAEATAESFDQVIDITRLPPDLNRQAAVRISRIRTVVRKPRKFYRTGFAGMGNPVFNIQGDVIGIQTLHVDSAEVVVLPGKTILRVVEDISEPGDGSKEE